MTTDPNTEWDYDKLKEGLKGLEKAKALSAITSKNARTAKYLQEAMQHTIEFIEYNMREGNVVSPTETYLTIK
jgi:hypothetical protein